MQNIFSLVILWRVVLYTDEELDGIFLHLFLIVVL